jgi:hypothetical protein
MLFISLFIAMLFIVVAAAKTILFQKSINDKKLLYWFYFSRYNVIPSSKETRKYKELQNKLSVILFAMLLFELLFWLVIKKYS